jgi:putative SOS response-associated peptidase YedK
MCGRFGFFELSYFIEKLRQLELPFEEAPRFAYRQSWNIPPETGIVTLLGDHERFTLSIARWGLIPHWATSLPKVRPINARADSIAVKPYFRHMMNHRHCLVPASGFYEWKKTDDGMTREPWYFRRRDGEPMAMAGLWDEWQEPGSTAPPVLSCSIITTAANRLMQPVHDRMPVILEPGDWRHWLESGKSGALELMKAPGEDVLEMYPVSHVVNSPRNNGPECIMPAESQGNS